MSDKKTSVISSFKHAIKFILTGQPENQSTTINIHPHDIVCLYQSVQHTLGTYFK